MFIHKREKENNFYSKDEYKKIKEESKINYKKYEYYKTLYITLYTIKTL